MKRLKYTYFYVALAVIVLVSAYMFLTSNLFLNKFLLKTISSDMGINISVKEIDLSLFKREIIISDYHIDKSETYCIEGKKIKCKFGLLSLFKKELFIKELSFDNSRLSIFGHHENFLEGKNISKTNSSGKVFKRISFHDLSFKNSSVDLFKFSNTRDKIKILSVDNINFKLPILAGNKLCKARLSGNFWVESINDKYESSGKIFSDINVFVDEKFNPLYIDLRSKITEIEGFIDNVSFKNHNIILEAKAELNDESLNVKFFNLKEYLKGELLSDIHLKGFIKPQPFFYDFQLNINSISSELLNTISALVCDYQFIDSTLLNFDGRCLYKEEKFSTQGNLHIKKLYIPEKEIVSTKNHNLNLDFKYNFSIDLKKEVIAINEFNLKIKAPDNGKIDLYSKGENILGFRSNHLNFHKLEGIVFHSYNFDVDYISNLLWNIFGIEKVGGRLNAVVGLATEGNNLKLKGPIEISSLTLKKGKFFVESLNLKNNISCSITKKFKILFNDVSGILSKDNKKISQIRIKGLYDFNSNNGVLDVKIPYVNYEFLNIFLRNNRESKFDKLAVKKLDGISLDIDNKFKFDMDNGVFLIDNLNLKFKDLNNTIAVINTYRPIQFQLKNNTIILIDKSVKFKIESNEYDLKGVNKYLPFRIEEGKLNSLIDGEIYGNYKEIKLNGIFKIDDITLNINNEEFKNLAFSNKFDLKLTNLEKIALKSNITELFKDEKFILTVFASGNYNINDKKGKIKSKIVESDLSLFDEVSERYLKPYGIELVKISGDILFEFKKGIDEFIASGKFKGDELLFTHSVENKIKNTFAGELNYKIAKTDNYLAIDPLYLKLNENSTEFLDLSLNIFVPMNSNDNTKIKLYSNNIDLKNVNNILNYIEGGSSNNKINMKGRNSTVDIYFENMYYGPFLKMDLESKFKVKNGYMKLNPTILNLNKTPVYLKGYADFSQNDKLPFELDADFYDLNIAPFLKTYDEIVYSNSKGVISKFNLKLNGDLKNKNRLLNSINGKLKATSKNVSIPFDFNKFDFMRIMFIPFEVITKISGVFTGANMPRFFTGLMHFSNNIFTNAQNLDIDKGDILLEVYNKQVYIDRFTLNADNSPMKSLNISGKIGFDSSINIVETIVGNNNFILPLVVKGSIDKPIPDNIKYIKLINDNILRPLKTVLWDTMNLPVNVVEDID